VFQLPPKKGNIDKKKPNNFCWRQLPLKKPNLLNLPSKEPIWQPWRCVFRKDQADNFIYAVTDVLLRVFKTFLFRRYVSVCHGHDSLCAFCDFCCIAVSWQAWWKPDVSWTFSGNVGLVFIFTSVNHSFLNVILLVTSAILIIKVVVQFLLYSLYLSCTKKKRMRLSRSAKSQDYRLATDGAFVSTSVKM